MCGQTQLLIANHIQPCPAHDQNVPGSLPPANKNQRGRAWSEAIIIVYVTTQPESQSHLRTYTVTGFLATGRGKMVLTSVHVPSREVWVHAPQGKFETNFITV